MVCSIKVWVLYQCKVSSSQGKLRKEKYIESLKWVLKQETTVKRERQREFRMEYEFIDVLYLVLVCSN